MKMRNPGQRLGGWVLTAVLCLVLVMGCAQESLMTQVTLGQAFVALNGISAWIAKEQGFFEKYGLDVTISLIRGDTQGIQALVGGSVDFLMAGAVAAMAANAEGADVIALATLGSVMPYILVAVPEIQSPQDLKGKRIGVSGTGLSVSRAALEIALRNFNLEPRRDGIVFLPTGSASERVMAVTTGGIHATVLSMAQHPRVARLEREGKLRVLADLSELNISWDHDFFLTTEAYRDAHQDVVEGLMKAILEASAFILDPVNKESVLQSIATNLSADELAEEIYVYVPKTVDARPYPSKDSISTVADILSQDFPSLEKLDVDRLVDSSFLLQLDESGFIDSLYSDSEEQ